MAKVEIRRGNGTIVIADTDERSLTRGRYHVEFTPVEWKLVRLLYEARPNVVSRDDLILAIWGENHKNVPTRTVDVHISSIRKKIAYIKGARIDSVYGRGYRLLMLTRF